MRRSLVSGAIVAAAILVGAAAMLGGHAEPDPEANLRILCVMTDIRGGEVVVIFNESGRWIDLSGYRLESEGGQSFEFGISEANPQPPWISPFDIVRVHSGICELLAGARDFFWETVEGTCYTAEVWNNQGDVARLYAPGGSIPIAEYSYP